MELSCIQPLEVVEILVSSISSWASETIAVGDRCKLNPLPRSVWEGRVCLHRCSLRQPLQTNPLLPMKIPKPPKLDTLSELHIFKRLEERKLGQVIVGCQPISYTTHTTPSISPTPTRPLAKPILLSKCTIRDTVSALASRTVQGGTRPSF